MNKLASFRTSGPISYLLFKTLARQKQPSPADFDCLLLTLDSMQKNIDGSQSTLWDSLARLKLIPSQESIMRGLMIDIAQGSLLFSARPDQKASEREALFKRTIASLQKIAREEARRISRLRKIYPAKPSLESLERIFS